MTTFANSKLNLQVKFDGGIPLKFLNGSANFQPRPNARCSRIRNRVTLTPWG
jgi:hypothetical protein